MQKLFSALVVLATCAAPALAQDSAKLFDQLASKNEAEAKTAHAELLKLGDSVIAEVERRLKKKPSERVAERLRALLSAIQNGGLEALLTPRLELPEATRGVPALISPDGKHVAYGARIEGETRRFEYRVATFTDDGKLKTKAVHACGEKFRDDFMVPALMPGSWSPDSRYLGYVDALEGGPRKSTTVGYVDVKTGKSTELGSGEGEMHLSVRFHPKGGKLAWAKLVLAGDFPDGALMLHDMKTKETTSLKLPEGFLAIEMNYLADGRMAVLGMTFSTEEGVMQRPGGKLAIVSADGKTTTVLAQEFNPDDFFWDGPPILLHQPGTERFFCESRGAEGTKRPSRIFAFGTTDKETKELVAESTASLVAMIDAKRASVVIHGEDGGAGVMDLETGAVTRLGHKRLLVHRVGERSVFLDVEARKLFVN